MKNIPSIPLAVDPSYTKEDEAVLNEFYTTEHPLEISSLQGKDQVSFADYLKRNVVLRKEANKLGKRSKKRKLNK